MPIFAVLFSKVFAIFYMCVPNVLPSNSSVPAFGING
jgi:hypothetical protein